MESPDDRVSPLELTCAQWLLEACLRCTCVDQCLQASMYDIHANEDICDFKRVVCYESVILTIGLVDFFTGFLYLPFCESRTNGLTDFFIGLFAFLETLLESRCPNCMARVKQD